MIYGYTGRPAIDIDHQLWTFFLAKYEPIMDKETHSFKSFSNSSVLAYHQLIFSDKSQPFHLMKGWKDQNSFIQNQMFWRPSAAKINKIF